MILISGIGRPNLLITDAFNALYSQPKQKQRDENLVSKLLSTVRDGGDVMIVSYFKLILKEIFENLYLSWTYF